MAQCGKKITEAILFDCDDKPKAGISESKAVIINYDDIDRAASTVSGSIVTDLVLKAGAEAFPVEWYKDLANSGGTFKPNAEAIDGFGHDFLTRLTNSSAANAERAAELSRGLFVLVYETKYKGVLSAEAFKVAGWENGLKLTEMTNRTNENSGSTLFTLATQEDEYETYPYNIFLETDYATSKATFDALFATV